MRRRSRRAKAPRQRPLEWPASPGSRAAFAGIGPVPASFPRPPARAALIEPAKIAKSRCRGRCAPVIPRDVLSAATEKRKWGNRGAPSCVGASDLRVPGRQSIRQCKTSELVARIAAWKGTAEEHTADRSASGPRQGRNTQTFSGSGASVIVPGRGSGMRGASPAEPDRPDRRPGQ